MASFFEGPTSRAERYRKQQYYKNMLDEQLHYQNLNRQSQVSDYKYAMNPSRMSEPYQHYPSTHKHQPLKRYSYSRNSPNPKTRVHTQAVQRAQKYLQSYELMVNNLRELTQKRKQKQMELLRLQSRQRPDFKSKKEEQEQVQQYLRSRNNESLYRNREQPEKKRQKLQLKPLKMIDTLSKSTDYEKGKSIKVSSSKKKPIKIQPKEKTQESPRSNISISQSKSRQLSQIQRNQQNKSLNPEKKQLYETMIQLMKYFKAKNEEMEEQKKKGELINEEVQATPPIENQEPTSKKKLQSNASDLKLKALIKLRQLNLKGRQLVAKLKKAKIQDDQNNQSKSQQKKTQSKKQPRLKSKFEEEIKKKNKQQQQMKKERERSQNYQLLKAIAFQLNKQEQQNQSLTYCLRELNQFVKDQNQEIQVLKQNQIQSAKKLQSKKQNKQAPKFRAEEFPKVKISPPPPSNEKKEKQKPKVQHSKQQQDKLKEAFLKKLKKLRLKGKQLNDKVQTYKKLHNTQHQQNCQQKQQSQQQINPQLQTQSPRDLKLTKQPV